MGFTHDETSFDVLLDVRSRIFEFLSGHRLMHTLSVETEAVSIAKEIFPSLNIDSKYLYDISCAALLHDITKQFDEQMQREICKKHSLEYKSSPTLHARTGAFFAKDTWNINEYVFSAIFFHTTGKEDMNIFEKIIFIADYIEKMRSAPSCIEARSYFWNNIKGTENKLEVLDKTILLSLNFTLDYLAEKGAEIDEDTIKARDYFLAEYALQ